MLDVKVKIHCRYEKHAEYLNGLHSNFRLGFWFFYGGL